MDNINTNNVNIVVNDIDDSILVLENDSTILIKQNSRCKVNEIIIKDKCINLTINTDGDSVVNQISTIEVNTNCSINFNVKGILLRQILCKGNCSKLTLTGKAIIVVDSSTSGYLIPIGNQGMITSQEFFPSQLQTDFTIDCYGIVTISRIPNCGIGTLGVKYVTDVNFTENCKMRYTPKNLIPICHEDLLSTKNIDIDSYFKYSRDKEYAEHVFKNTLTYYVNTIFDKDALCKIPLFISEEQLSINTIPFISIFECLDDVVPNAVKLYEDFLIKVNESYKVNTPRYSDPKEQFYLDIESLAGNLYYALNSMISRLTKDNFMVGVSKLLHSYMLVSSTHDLAHPDIAYSITVFVASIHYLKLYKEYPDKLFNLLSLQNPSYNLSIRGSDVFKYNYFSEAYRYFNYNTKEGFYGEHYVMYIEGKVSIDKIEEELESYHDNTERTILLALQDALREKD